MKGNRARAIKMIQHRQFKFLLSNMRFLNMDTLRATILNNKKNTT